MNDIIPSNLIDQLIDLAEINSIEKFFFHYPLLIWAISVALFIFLAYPSTSAAKQQKNPEGQKSVLLTLMTKEWWILFDLVICAVPVFIVGASDAGLRHSKELNQPQIALVKSIASPEFQGLMQDSIKVNGLTIYAVEESLLNYERLYLGKGPKDLLDRGAKGLEIYNNFEVKQ